MCRLQLTRAAVVLAATAVAVLGFAASASAHVTINPVTASRGGDATVSFQVPNEQDAATTVKVELSLPADAPIGSVSTRPVVGWTATTTTTKLATPIKTDDGDVNETVTKVTWTAEAGGGIKAGEFQQFQLALGSLPDTDKIVFKALQTYSDGTVVRWIEEPTPGEAHPEHPAPVLTLTDGSHAVAARADIIGHTPAAAPGSNGTAVGLAVAGLFVGLAGLGIGLLAYRRASTAAA
ncbi:YcnI family protein [Dactylosporangium sp. NPDC048998]|uniref:YcnI family copper-binding membrane protein n=1 Tax=Dactylosporangium sp. NPDC048998 TaxID=3363976 RepID=UPI00371469BB